MGVGAPMVSTDWVALTSLWEAPTSSPWKKDCPDVEASREMDMVTEVHSSCGSVAGGVTARVALTSGLKVLFPQSVPLKM
jgi:hypothetical protein